MRVPAILFSLVILMNSAALAEETTVQDVITAQIDAFKQEDVGTAFAFASPAIQRLFRNPDTFGSMVRNGYPMVWSPADMEFLRQHEANGVTYQETRFRDASGNAHLFVYEMVQVDNVWKINGLFPLQPPGVAA